jgi:hypothetical protein
MWRIKGKVPRERARPAPLSAKKLVKKLAKQSAKKSAKQSDQSSVGGLAPAHPRSAEQREIIVSRVWRFSPWVLLGILAAAPLAPAAGQNLDAGKPASQIFAEVCANCHRSPREFRGNPGTSFLREHYTTGSDMAATMSAYLSSSGSDSRAGGAPQPKRQPQANPATPAATATTRDAPAADREPRRAQQTPDPKDPKAAAPATTRGRPASVAETKPPSPPAPARPVLEDFEE